MSRSHTYREWDSQRDIDRVASLISQAFGESVDACRSWVCESPGRSIRVVDRAGAAAPDACLFLIPMGQFFGGRSVPMTGIAGVAVAPDARGTGLASFMMTEALREMRAGGVALSTLYAATQPVYRKVGYEQAGALCEFTFDPAQLRGFREPALSAAPLTLDDLPRLREAYTSFAGPRDGYLDRREYIWNRVFKPRGKEAQGWGVFAGDALQGAVFVHSQPGDGATHKRILLLSDVWANTPGALRRILSFLADHASVIRQVRFSGASPSPLLMALHEQSESTARVRDYWMLRVLDVSRALEARGYPRGLQSELTLEVSDDVLPENSGAYHLTVEDGAATVTRSRPGDPSTARSGFVRTDARALASMYSGFASPHMLAAMTDRVQGDGLGLSTLAALFAGPAPGMPDGF